MQEFRIRRDGFKEIRNKMLIRITPVLLIAATGGIIIGTLTSKDKADDINILPFLIPFMLVAVGIGLYRGIKRQKIKFDSYLLTLTNNLISREQHNTPVVAIYFNDIKKIVKHRNGWFTLQGKANTDVIIIPAQIENYSDLEAALNNIKPITTQTEFAWIQKLKGLLPFVSIGLMVCVYTLGNKIIVGASGLILIVLMVWGFFRIRNSRNIDYKTKNRAWWLMGVLIFVVAVMIMKLTGYKM